MNFAGDFAILQMGDQRNADWISNFVPCAEWVGGRERKSFIRLDFFGRPFRSIDGRMPDMQAALRPIAQYAAFGFHRWIAQNIFIPLLPVLDPITYFLELSFRITFILGFLVRPMAAIGILFVAQLWLGLYRQPGMAVALRIPDVHAGLLRCHQCRKEPWPRCATNAVTTWSVQGGGPNRPPIPRGYLRSVR